MQTNMPNFFSKKEYQEIADIYCLGKIKKIYYLHKGLQTPKVCLTVPKGIFVVSKYSLSNKKKIISKSEKSLQYEIDLLNFLKNLPVSNFIISDSGNYIEKYKRFWITVDKYIKGSTPKTINTKMAEQLGIFLGKFHKQGMRFKKRNKERRKFYDLRPVVLKQMHPIALRQTNKILKGVVKEVKRGVIENFPPKNMEIGPIHVDIKPENELFSRGKLTGVVDFGNFYIGPLMIDVGKTIMWNCCKNKRLNKKLLKEFVKGYQSQRKMNNDECNYLRKSILYAIYSHIYVDLYHVPLKYVPESYTLFLVNNFLPIARKMMKSSRDARV